MQHRTDRLPLGRPTSRVSLEPALRSNVDDGIVMLDALFEDFPARSFGDRRAETRGDTTAPARRRVESPLPHWISDSG